ncbi:MAG: tetratricopeptide repeat protein [Ardenticatenia bacterium]|nr:tetratricopeptide repeat protein [Ardenticatenia bacterium]
MDTVQAAQHAFEAGIEHFKREEYDQAIACFEQGLAWATNQANRELEAHLRLLIGQSAFELDDVPRAREELVQAHELFRQLGDRSKQAHTRRELGELTFWHEQYELAQRHYRRALELLQEIESDDIETLALIHTRLGAIAFEQEELDIAHTHYQQALACYHQLGDTVSAANLLIELATNVQPEDPNRARELFEQGHLLAQQAGDEYLASVALHGLGVLAADNGRLDEAVSWYRQALTLKEHCGDQEGQIFTYLALGAAYRELGRIDQARAAWQQALRLAKHEEFEDVVVVVRALIESRVEDWLRS